MLHTIVGYQQQTLTITKFAHGNGNVELRYAIKTIQIAAGKPAGIVILASDRQIGMAEII